ncbi:recombinase family protein [Actinacidiphila sp. ITFR-21]|uniref:recombinase family protein n=1 Tax=Actinacidiphila sp. ITFR-21 TaxID=3075199 RepID=UPI00288C2A1E|nr:recombinase family protein [Streptomyces sp. ITFR-21]WNI16949.1 recombinase family protein [Streptomyces sp. ITFR-21]
MKTPDGQQIRAVIYVRISQDRTGAGLGVERQREDCEALAERMGFEVVRVYPDNDISAFSGKKRPGYRRMLDDLDAGTATVVICWHTDRLHRSPTELEEYISLCERRGITTHTVQAGELDLATPSGRMVARMLGAVARQESEHKGERVARARLQKAQAGEWAGGIRPFGWGLPTGGTRVVADKKTGDEIEVPVLDYDKAVPGEAALVLESTEDIIAGKSLRGWVQLLADKGVVSTMGNPIGTIEWRDILLRPRNAGIVIYRGQPVGRGKWDVIVPEPTWRAAVAVLEDPARRTTPGNRPRWLGSLLFECGKEGCLCPGPMKVSGTGNKDHRPAYRCQLGQVTRRADVLDDYVRDVILERLSRPDAAGLLLPLADESAVAELQAQQVELRGRLTTLASAFGSGLVDASQLAEGSSVINAQLSTVLAQLAAAASKDPLVDLVGTADPWAVWKGMELEQRRNVLRALVTVRIRPGRRGRMPDGSYQDMESIEFEWKRTP